MENLQGKVVIVTGASGGIGSAIVERLVLARCKVVLAARRKEVLEQFKEKLGGGEGILCVKCDVTVQSDLENLITETKKTFGTVDVVVNGAGVSSQYPFWKQPLEDLEKVMFTNYYSYVMLARLVVNHMKENGGGHIVNITSGSVMVEPPPRNFIVYTSLKVALRAFAKGLFWEMRDFGIKVTSIFPGVTKTPLTSKLKDVSEDETKLMDPAVIADTVIFALGQPRNTCPLELSVINQQTPWTKPVIPFKQNQPDR